MAGTCSPQRADVKIMNPSLDERKPLAAVDTSGWVHVDGLLIGSVDNQWVAAYDLGKESFRWWRQVKASVSAPILSTRLNSVILATKEGLVTSLNQETGDVIWQSQLGSFVNRGMLENEGRIYVATAAQQLFALNIKNGKRDWVFDGASLAEIILSGGAVPAVVGNQVLFGASNGNLFGLAVQDGKQLWQLDMNLQMKSTSQDNAPADSVSIVSSNRFSDIISRIYASGTAALVSSYTGQVSSLKILPDESVPSVVWSRSLPSVTSSDFRDGIWYLGHLNGDVSALEASSGRIIWQASLGQAAGSLYAGEAALYVGGSQGRITALKKESGDMFWFDDVGGSIVSPPLVVDKKLYFYTGSKVLYGYVLF